METYAATASPPTCVDKLSHQLFSLLESEFLIGGWCPSGPGRPARALLDGGGRVRVLAIDGCGAGAEDALLAAAALARLEAKLRDCTGDPDARVADFFDVAAGAGAGGVLAAMLLLRGADGQPRYSAQEALAFVAGIVGRKDWCGRSRRGGWAKLFQGSRGGGDRMLRRVFGDATLRDTVAPLLVPCYDLGTAAPFVFSRADAVESDSFDFRLRDVCAATCAAGGALASEFPLATGVEDLLVLSIGAGASSATVSVCDGSSTPMPTRSPSPRELARVTAEGVADMVDESVAMAFGLACGSNYVRIQAGKAPAPLHAATASAAAGAMLAQRNVESVLFQGRRLSERTNAEKVDAMAAELVKEQERRRRSPLPNVAIKQVGTPRLSSATTASSGTATARTASTMPSPASWESRR
ncbi:unnamed protein product [Miscanthus lutarioriparius]|uniref:Patatin n=1 Tax=Miscanthus lutarioriparius TaxID=422564 RepID=A0A811MWN0_9POAL|nr:unnamed protein product [Miscanthus lutarioriparius]